ncbi:TPA: hypothetical protein QEK30_004484, partial [Stenotrophomonas maltophilia]|nr:hypothetical protein [Stenotrophomonas maltophilia]
VRPSSVAFGYTLQTRLGNAAFAEAGTADFAPTGLLTTAMPAKSEPTAIALAAGVSLDAVEVGSEALIDDELVR